MKYTYLILFLLINLNLFGQDFNVRLIKTIPDYYPHVITTLQVFDLNDDPIKDLKPENFNISVNGKSVDSLNVITYKESGKGLNIMLCLDLSGTMSGKPLQTMKDAVLKFLDEMRNVDKLAIIGFADDYDLISDFSSDKQYLKNRVKSLTTRGTKTALYYATYQGLVKLRDLKDQAGKILLVIGDGKDESVASSYTIDDVINLAKNEGIPIFSIGYSKIDKSYLQTLEKMSEQTGGKFYNSPTDSDLEKQYNKLYEQILNIYILSYLVVGLPGDGSEYNNVITVNYRNQKKTVSNKFISPAGVPAYNKVIATKKDSLSDKIYYFIAAGVLILGVVAFIIIKSRRKKKETTSEFESSINQKEAQVQETSIPISNQQQMETSTPSKNVDSSPQDDIETVVESSKDREDIEERTIIVRSGSATTLTLEVLTGNFAGKTFHIKAQNATIGRQEDNDIVIKEDNISRKHAKIIYANGEFYIEDLNSSNGTYINGVKITNPVKINNYDTFKFGSCEGRFLIS